MIVDVVSLLDSTPCASTWAGFAGVMGVNGVAALPALSRGSSRLARLSPVLTSTVGSWTSESNLHMCTFICIYIYISYIQMCLIQIMIDSYSFRKYAAQTAKLFVLSQNMYHVTL